MNGKYQKIQNELQARKERLLAIELKKSLVAALEEELEGKVIELEDLAAEFGFSSEDFDPGRRPPKRKRKSHSKR